MGWDAFTSARTDYKLNKLKSKRIDKLFDNATKYVVKKAGSADIYLRTAGLDCSACALMLQEATGESVWVDKKWNREYVRKVNREADWNFEYDKEDAWAYWSARKFLETCARAGLSIHFSY